jgi:DNA polymerase phi
MKLVLDASKAQGSMSGQEERDNLFARLFGITSVIHSGLIVRNGTLPTSSTSASSPESYELIVSTLVALGEKKSWLRESAWWVLASAVEVLEKSDVEWKNQGVESTFDTVYAKGSGWTPEKVALTLKLQALFPERDWSSVLSPVFKGTDILATQNLGILANILKACPGTFLHHHATLMFRRSLGSRKKIPSRARLPERGNLSCTSFGISSSIYCYLRTKTPPLRIPSKIFGV